MEKLLEQIAEILDVEEVDKTKKFTDYDEWDSLSDIIWSLMFTIPRYVLLING